MALRGRAFRMGPHVGEPLDQLLHPDHRHLDARERGDEAGVPLVRDHDERPGLGHRDVGAGDAHVGRQELLAQLAPGHGHELRDVGDELRLHLAREDARHLLLREVDGGHDHVGRALAGQLHDPFAQVGLGHLDALLRQEGVQVHLLGHHRLRLGDALDAVLLAEAPQVRLRLPDIGGPEDLRARLGGGLLELLGELVEVGGGTPLQPHELVAEGLEVDPLVGLRPGDEVGVVEAPERAPHGPVLQRSGDAILEVGDGHHATPISPSTAMRTSFFGPWTPMVSTRSMSAVRLGPVTHAM